MADTLKFRGGSTSDITSSTVSDREIVFDTDKNTLVLGSAKDYLMRYGGNSQSGNVGIGVASPSTTLEVGGTVTATAFAGPVTGNLTGNLTGNVTGNLTGNVTGNVTGNLTGNVSNDTVIISAGSTERMRIVSSGNVGIGTSNPQTKLAVSGTVGLGSTTHFTNNLRDSQTIFDRSPQLQINSTNGPGSSIGLISWHSSESGFYSPQLWLAKSNGSVGSNVLVTNNTDLGSINFAGNNGTSFLNAASIRAEVDGTANSNDMPGRLVFFTTDTDDNTTERMRINRIGNVGIGTSNIEGKLHIKENSNSLKNLLYLQNRNAGANAGSQIAFSNATNDLSDNRFAFIRALTTGAGQNGNILTFGTNPNGGVPEERLRVDSNGRLLVGTSSELSVNGITSGVQVHGTTTNNGASISIARFRDDISPPVLSFGKSRNTSIGPGTIVQSQDVLGQIAFSGDDGAGLNTPIARIDSLVDGNPLQTSGTVRIPACLTFSTASNVGGLAERVRITGSGSLQIHQTTSNTPGFNNTTTGSSIERTNSGSALFVSRSDNTTAFFNRNSNGNLLRFFRSGTQVGSIDVTTSTSAFVGTSDYRLKENITDLSNGIDRLKLLTPRRFNFIAEPDRTIDGFIAHEMQAAVPEAVFGEKDATEDQEVEVTPAVLDEDGNVTTEAVVETKSVISPQGIDQSKLVPLLTAALQEAIAKIEVLEQRLSDAGIA